ncbi:unnamed protein product [Heligmosomoides polygyrus]|uniref:Uncharacterized protein n=1 Tax=Heligmosomoides polygyrus TaxID=6339 RepID=A0A183GFC2_HELPZ|nr:unnamed protein product [Heligmosomoides polygyrus]
MKVESSGVGLPEAKKRPASSDTYKALRRRSLGHAALHMAPSYEELPPVIFWNHTAPKSRTVTVTAAFKFGSENRLPPVQQQVFSRFCLFNITKRFSPDRHFAAGERGTARRNRKPVVAHTCVTIRLSLKLDESASSDTPVLVFGFSPQRESPVPSLLFKSADGFHLLLFREHCSSQLDYEPRQQCADIHQHSLIATSLRRQAIGKS